MWDIENHFLPVLEFYAHELEVWTCHFKEHSNDQILLTGSDDSLLKLWDLRGNPIKPAAVIKNGHSAGVTTIGSFGKENYFVSGR